MFDVKIEYKDRLSVLCRQGEGMMSILWIKFFLKAASASAKKTTRLIEALGNARQTHTDMPPQISNGNKSIKFIYEYVANTVIVNVRQSSGTLGLSLSNVSKVVKAF